ncbi:MAG: hypothetical protein EOO71_31650 [Myxococcaceae bacterium]|nr:MAG: hypothetical protein EOO71_31650 [Myxococcaceae bacterium]
MLTTLKRTALGLSIAASAVLSLVPQTALAYRAYSTAGCFTEGDYTTDFVWSLGIANQSGGIGARARTIRCPIDDDNSVAAGGSTVAWRPSIASLNVVGYDGNNGTTDTVHNVVASVCYVWNDGGGAHCSVPAVMKPVNTDVTFTGPFAVPVPAALLNEVRSAWQGDFTYLQLTLPQQGPLGNSVVYGYSTY